MCAIGGAIAGTFLQSYFEDKKKESPGYLYVEKQRDAALAKVRLKTIPKQVGIASINSQLRPVSEKITAPYGAALPQTRTLAEQGSANEQYNLGIMYADGQGVKQDHQEALRWFRLSAAQGNCKAQGELGYMYQGGQGVHQDNVQAMMWYLIAKLGGTKLADEKLQELESQSTPTQIAEAQRMAREWRMPSNWEENQTPATEKK